MSRAARASLLALGLACGLSATSCNDYKYFDVHVTLDPLTFSSTSAAQISLCRVTVSGAASDSFPIDNCPKSPTASAPLDIGVFTFSSFADSGTVTFKLDTYAGQGQKPNCIFGSGMVAVPVAGATTLTAELKVVKTGSPSADCLNIAPAPDGGP